MRKDSFFLLLKPAFKFTINISLFSIRKMSQQNYQDYRYKRVASSVNSSKEKYDKPYSSSSYSSSYSYNNNWNRRHYRTDNWGDSRYHQNSKKSRDIKISKKLAYILRHGASEMNLHMNQYGFVNVDEILALPGYKRISERDIIRIVQTNEKQRFHLQRDPYGSLMIGANQGHTIKCEKLELEPITDAGSHPCVVHGTTYNAWRNIEKDGLKTMNRNHIHFASGEPGEKGVISGMRSSSQVLIYIDLRKALSYGIKFFLSRNQVILSEGDESGRIDPFFFKSVIDRKTRNMLY